MLAVASIMPLDDGTLPAGIMVYRIGDDGKLTFVRKYDVDVGNRAAILERHGHVALTAKPHGGIKMCLLARAGRLPILLAANSIPA